MCMSLWFYEWNMFGAVEEGQHTHGVWDNAISVLANGTRATITSGSSLRLTIAAVDDGAEMRLAATNQSTHDWPELAAIVPCFNPGPPDDRPNLSFVNTHTLFMSEGGLSPIHVKSPREIHYRAALRAAIDGESDNGRFIWTEKWPTSEADAVAGVIVRQSTDEEWVSGIAWERFLSCQAHNPWHCMHLSAHLGPLRRGESRAVRGKMYLFQGRAADVLDRFQGDLGGADGRDNEAAR